MLILTEWEEFAQLDLVKLNQVVKFPIVIDGRNLYNPVGDAGARIYVFECRPPGQYQRSRGSRAAFGLWAYRERGGIFFHFILRKIEECACVW